MTADAYARMRADMDSEVNRRVEEESRKRFAELDE
jgi:hypothetical protein